MVRISDVDEDAVAAALPHGSTHETIVTELAVAKASTIADTAPHDPELATGTVVVVGCDSMLSIGGHLAGKPGSIDIARARWSTMAGSHGDLLTGHSVIRLDDGAVTAQSTAHSSTTVHFTVPDPVDLEAYLQSGEPLSVAGGFTLDGLGGWFVDRIEGDPSSVIGIGLPLIRRLFADVGVGVADLWAGAAGTGI